MIKTSIEKLAAEIGYDIGTSDDVTQAKLLNGFCKGLSNSMRDDHAQNLQICYLVDKLDSKSQYIIKEIAAFIDEKEKD